MVTTDKIKELVDARARHERLRIEHDRRVAEGDLDLENFRKYELGGAEKEYRGLELEVYDLIESAAGARAVIAYLDELMKDMGEEDEVDHKGLGILASAQAVLRKEEKRLQERGV